jgi:alpha-amylase
VEKFKLAFGIHNHQPVGNFEFVFEEAHQRAYAPFLKLLSQYKGIRLSLHQSGILWDWQQHHHGEYLETVKEMAARGQIDILTGGFYEPILTAIPERDAKGQIAQLTQYVRDQFDIYPEGLWLTERIWEPHLPKLLAQAQVKYLPIDDTHFLYAGMEQSQLSGPFVTEHEGHSVTLLPIQKRLRYLIPFGKVEEVIVELRKQADRNPTGIAVYADDGEKFGVWPKTYEHCYEDKWLENRKWCRWARPIIKSRSAAPTYHRHPTPRCCIGRSRLRRLSSMRILKTGSPKRAWQTSTAVLCAAGTGAASCLSMKRQI